MKDIVETILLIAVIFWIAKSFAVSYIPPKYKLCEECDGKGYVEKTCDECNGEGKITIRFEYSRQENRERSYWSSCNGKYRKGSTRKDEFEVKACKKCYRGLYDSRKSGIGKVRVKCKACNGKKKVKVEEKVKSSCEEGCH